jgi:hypothetical protein
MKALHNEEVPPPKRILIVSPTANGLDAILDKLDIQGFKHVKIVRLGKSHVREDLNKKYCIQLSEAALEDRAKKQMET